MRKIQSEGICFDGNQLKILDQTLLPFEETWLPCENAQDLVHIIRRLSIRGAPAIGIAASLLLATLARKGRSRKDLTNDCVLLGCSRPTAVNLHNNLVLMQEAINSRHFPDSVVQCAEEIFLEDIQLCQKIAENGQKIIDDDDKILTHCHTGGIATAGIGTALGIIRTAHNLNRGVTVWIDETRPLLQGGRLTSWECSKHNIPHKLICDNMAAQLMKNGMVDKILVGSDRIAANGDFANKIGTYSLAVLANFHSIPFYVAAPYTTVDPNCPDGDAIPIEERAEEEIKGVSGSFGTCQWVPDSTEVYNPAFDITPAGLVTGWILDTGLYTIKDVLEGKLIKR